MKTLFDLYLELDDEITSLTVLDDADGTEEHFNWTFDALNWYGEDREIRTLVSDRQPDENGHMEITLAA